MADLSYMALFILLHPCVPRSGFRDAEGYSTDPFLSRARIILRSPAINSEFYIIRTAGTPHSYSRYLVLSIIVTSVLILSSFLYHDFFNYEISQQASRKRDMVLG